MEEGGGRNKEFEGSRGKWSCDYEENNGEKTDVHILLVIILQTFCFITETTFYAVLKYHFF